MSKRSAARVEEEEGPELHPKLAEHLVAHAAVEKQLLGMATTNRLPHALLFAGPRGVGKATLAWRLARFLIAPQDKGDSLFGAPLPPESLHIAATHPTFRRMAADAHPDFLLLEAEDIKIEEARSVAAFLALTPAESDWRVVIIDSADAMNRNAANALLKTLEEPPPRAVLLLVSHNPGALLPTIRSRCRILRVPPLNDTEFARVMATAAPDLTPQQSQVWSLLSGGSPGVALSLIDARADALYKELGERISSADIIKNQSFADRFARKDAEKDWLVLSRLFLWLLARVASGVGDGEVFGGEQAILARLREAKPLTFWLDLRERANKLFHDADNLYLDKKQVIISLLKATAE